MENQNRNQYIIKLKKSYFRTVKYYRWIYRAQLHHGSNSCDKIIPFFGSTNCKGLKYTRWGLLLPPKILSEPKVTLSEEPQFMHIFFHMIPRTYPGLIKNELLRSKSHYSYFLDSKGFIFNQTLTWYLLWNLLRALIWDSN